MPSRQLSTSPLNHRHRHHFLTALLASAASVCSLILLLLLCLRNRTRSRKRTTPSSDPPHQFSYSFLRRATNSFSTRLGHGGFGPVFSGSLPPAAKPVAVKLMDSASLQGEREFHNELFFASRLRSSHVVPAIGFSSDPERRRFLLVYDLMHNGNLHDSLFRRNCPELLQWNHRFAVVVDIAKGIQYLHSCDPPIIHGDIKPSNILLDLCFSAKIADFGLAMLKTETHLDQVEILGVESENKRKEGLESDGGSLAEETESVTSPAPEMGVKKNGKGNEVADYVMNWIGKEVNKERAKGNEWVVGAAAASSSSSGTRIGKKEKNKKLEWWESMDEEKDTGGVFKKVKRRPVREWWKEEYSQELAKKKKQKKNKKHRNGGNSDDDLWVRDDALYSDVNVNKSKTKHRSRNSGGSVDSWLGGELRRARRNSYESAASGEIPKSGGVSSSPSMRGTLFYVAPEYGYGGNLSEKCDVYSFGVLLLVLISGRRPLQVMTDSPLSEFHRANLVSWARHCARKGKLLELVDPSIQSLDKEQALLCIKLAFLCLQKSPARRPSMKEAVGMLSGELEAPQLPVEYSSSSPSRFPFKSRKEEGR